MLCVSYQCDLLDHMNTIDVLISILGKGAVSHHGILEAIVSIIHRNNHWVIVFNALRQLERRQIVVIKLDLPFTDLLVDTLANREIGDIVLTVRRIKHLWGVVRVFLFSDAHVDTDVSITKGIVLECDIQLLIICHTL